MMWRCSIIASEAATIAKVNLSLFRSRKVRRNKPTVKFVIGILLALSVGISLYLRIYLPYDQVFTGDWIKYTGIDAYFHMRLIDNFVHNFPQLTGFDPYFIYPGGGGVGTVRFFEWLLGGITWVVGLGSPTQHTVDIVGVYFPAVLGALIVIPVYFIGRELFNRWAGVIAAGLIAIIPGELLGRSILGFTDQHVAEVLFTTVVFLFLVLAIKAARQRQMTFNHLRQRDWASIRRPLVYSLFAGIFMGIYLLTWIGALLIAFTICFYFVIQFIIDHLKRKSTDYLCLIGVVFFLIAIIMFLPASSRGFYRISMFLALLLPLVLGVTSWFIARRGMRPIYYPLTLLGLGAVGIGIFYAINSSLFLGMVNQFAIFVPSETLRTTIEAQPLLFPQGKFTTQIAWGNFSTGFYLSFISLGFLIFYLIRKRGDAEKTLLVVWSVVILATALGQRRFAYYFAVNVALLTGYLSVLIYYVIRYIIDYLSSRSTDYMSWQALELADFEGLATQATASSTRAERKGVKLKERQVVRPAIHYSSIILWVIVIFFLVLFPNISPAVNTAKQARFAPTDAWMSSLSWLEENTPEPFSDPDAYYKLYEQPQPDESYNHPESAYGVLAWWDYGYWITRIAHRLPNANPSQAPAPITKVASFLLSQDEDSAVEVRKELDASYVIIDYQTATGKFWAVVTWLGREPSEFIDIYHKIQGNKGIPVIYFHPEYYRSLSVRLYNFDGKAVTPENTTVISYQEKVSQEGIRYKQIISEEKFDSYEKAEDYVLSQESGNYKIVGNNPFVSPVPLEALKQYQLIHSSQEAVASQDAGAIPEVKIFEFTGG